MSQVALVVKNLPAKAEGVRDVGSIPGWGRSPGGWNGNPLQCFMDRGTWWATVHKIAESDTTEVTEHTRTHMSIPPPTPIQGSIFRVSKWKKWSCHWSPRRKVTCAGRDFLLFLLVLLTRAFAFPTFTPQHTLPLYTSLPLSHSSPPAHTEEQLSSVGNAAQEETPGFCPLPSQHQRSGAVSTVEEALHA